MCRWGQRDPWRLECMVPAPLPHARACLHTGQTHSSEIWFPPIISAEKLCGGHDIPRGTGAPVFTFVDRLETTWGLWKKHCTDKYQDDIKTFYRNWLNMMIRSYQRKLFTVVRTEVHVKGESLSGNSPKHGPKMIHASIKPRKGLQAFSGVAGIYHFINSVNVFLSSRNENFLEGRCVNENVCSNSPSIFTISLLEGCFSSAPSSSKR